MCLSVGVCQLMDIHPQHTHTHTDKQYTFIQWRVFRCCALSFPGAVKTGMVSTVQNFFVIVLKNIVEIMGHVTHEITILPMAVPVMSNTVVTVVKSAISIVPMLHVMDMVTVQIMPSYHLVTSVNVRQDLLVMTAK